MNSDYSSSSAVNYNQESYDLDRDLVPEELLPYSDSKIRYLKHFCEQSLLMFTKFFFHLREQSKFITSSHHRIIANTLEQVYRGDITRLIINIPPGYTKTELAVINFVSWCLAKSPNSKFIHTSYNDDLVIENSTKIQDIVKSDVYQYFWPQTLREDAQAKKRWYTSRGGGMLAAPSGGGITGFRAGKMLSEFSGAIIIDDPVKPDDAFSDLIRGRVNNRFTNTMKSRLAHEQIPIIVIMQRIHEDDLTGYLLRGESGDQWHHLMIPVDIKDNPEPYPPEYKAGIPIEYSLKTGPLWKYKHNLEHIEILKKDIYTYSSQYDQRPTPLGGGLFKNEWWKFYKTYDPVKNLVYFSDDTSPITLNYKMIFADTAMKTSELNDYSVFQCWGMGKDGNIYLLDQVRGKWEAPDLRSKFLKFCERHDFKHKINIMGVRSRKVEDKASGTGLIQELNREKGIDWVIGIPRDKDKVSRAMSAAPQIANGKVWLPLNAFWLQDYLFEFEKFTPTMAHRHDDQIDATLDAIHDMMINSSFIDYSSALY